jgi:dTDP-4-amino-4,6-dideoxygalactose transaminase
MMRDVVPYLVGEATTVRDALRKLDDTGSGILLLVNEGGQLRRTVTDGDLRRLILAGSALDSTLGQLAPHVSTVTPEGTTAETALLVLNERKLDHLPVVDAGGRPLGVFLRRDIDSQILLSTPHMGEYEREYIEDAFRSNWVAPLGPNVDAFEKELADHVGIGHAAALVSGTAAIHLGLKLLGVKRDDPVFCSSLTFVASANPILYEGAVPVFIDAEPTTWNMSPQALERALQAARHKGRLPKAVVVVNLYGQSADLDPILELCNHYGVPVLEDAAESLGATYKGRHSGTFGRIATFSFNGNKIITTSGGGMLVAEDESLVKKARFLATQARDPAPYYQHTEVGYNYRMSNILAGIGRGQLRVLEARVDARRAVFDRYVRGLAGIDAIEWMPEASFGRSTRWLTACALRGMSADTLIQRLAAERIEARRVWKPMHLQPLFASAEYFPHEDGRDVAADLFARGVCLPSGSNMTEDQQQRIVGTISGMLRARAPAA